MSRIGKQPIPVPAGVDVTIDGQNVSVKGPKGTLDLTVAEPITVSRNDDGAIVVTRPNDERRNRSLHGLSRTLVSNLVTGVTRGLHHQDGDLRCRLPGAAQGLQSRVRAGIQPPRGDRGPRGHHVRGPVTDEVHRSPGSTSRRSARSRRISAVCAVPTRTRARACATRASRSAARSERQVSNHGANHKLAPPRESRWGRAYPRPGESPGCVGTHGCARRSRAPRSVRGWWCTGPRGTFTCNWSTTSTAPQWLPRRRSRPTCAAWTVTRKPTACGSVN